MFVILPTTQNMAELEYVHQAIAKLTRQYPRKVSSGRATPSGRQTPGMGGRRTPGPKLQAIGGRSVQTSVLVSECLRVSLRRDG